jgi:hypothetical protein
MRKMMHWKTAAKQDTRRFAIAATDAAYRKKTFCVFVDEVCYRGEGLLS